MPDAPVLMSEQTCRQEQGDTVFHCVEWTAPSNSENFDLDYYKLRVGNNTIDVARSRNSSIVAINCSLSGVDVSIVAVSRCGQRSTSSNVISVQLIISTPNSAVSSVHAYFVLLLLLTCVVLFCTNVSFM